MFHKAGITAFLAVLMALGFLGCTQPVSAQFVHQPEQGSNRLAPPPRADVLSTYDLSQYMTEIEQKRLGLDQLSDRQRQELARWIERFRGQVAEEEARGTFFYRIERNWNGGQEIHLDNRTVWRISPLYRRTTRNWLNGQRVEVRRKARRGSNYPHQLYNEQTGETVDARLSTQGP